MVVAGAVSAFGVYMSFCAAGEAEDDKLAWILDRESAQQRLVQQGKDGGIRANGQRKGDDGGNGEARRAHDLAQGETKITGKAHPSVPSEQSRSTRSAKRYASKPLTCRGVVRWICPNSSPCVRNRTVRLNYLRD